MAATDPERPNDHTDYSHRRRVNIIAGISIAVLLGILIWTLQTFLEYERLQRCYASGRRNCEKLDIPDTAPAGVVAPVR